MDLTHQGGSGFLVYEFDQDANCMPETYTKTRTLTARCFVAARNHYRPDAYQQWIVANLIRVGGYNGKLITSNNGLFYADMWEFFLTGLQCLYPEEF